MAENVKGIMLFAEHLPGYEMLTDAQLGGLVRALFADCGLREAPQMDETTRLVFLLVAPATRQALAKWQNRDRANQENGKKGGRPPKEPSEDKNEQEKPMGLGEKPMGFEGETEKPTAVNHIISNQNKSESINPPLPPSGGNARDPYSAEFELFWHAYPKKTGKDAAFRAWKAKKREKRLPSVDDLIAAIDKWRDTDKWQEDGGRFVPNPATWINQARWLDEAPEQEIIPHIHATLEEVEKWGTEEDEGR